MFDDIFFFVFKVIGHFFLSLKIISEKFKRVMGIMGFLRETCGLLFGCPMANFGPLLRGQPHSPDVNHCVFTYLTKMSSGAS